MAVAANVSVAPISSRSELDATVMLASLGPPPLDDDPPEGAVEPPPQAVSNPPIVKIAPNNHRR
jgi:hypothetical protein